MSDNPLPSHPIYSVPINLPGKNCSAIYRNPLSENALIGSPLPGIENLQELLLRTFNRYGNENCASNFPYNQYRTYSQLQDSAMNLGKGIQALNLAPQKFLEQNINYSTQSRKYLPGLSFVGIMAKNREEYLQIETMCCLFGIVSLSVYDTLGDQGVSYILQQTEVETLFTSGEQLKKLQNFHLQSVKNIVVFDEFTEEISKNFSQKNIKLISFKEVLAKGEQVKGITLPTLHKDSVYAFSYTSGTTGNPKGAMLSHGNMLSAIAAVNFSDSKLFNTDKHLSYLPLAHIFEKVMSMLMLFVGGKIGFYQGDTLKLKEDLASFKPTILASVPRLYNKFYDAINDKLKAVVGIKAKLASYAINSKLYYLRNQSTYHHRMWDKLVFNQIKQAFGGEIRLMVTASAPISGDVIDFLKIASCAPILEGYGQTESAGASFVTKKSDPHSGQVGGPCVCTEFKVEDVPDMNYTSKDMINGQLVPRGECLIRGPGVFLGYYKDMEKTKEAIDDEGWLHTGDIVQVNPNGSIKIIDRKKNIFKLAQGEYVAAEKIELVVQGMSLIDEVFIYGDSLQIFLIGIVLPNKKYFVEYAHSNGFTGEFPELIKNQELNKLVQKEIEKECRTKKLLGFEIPKKITFINDNMVNLGICTATGKLKRHEAKNYFMDDINRMYKQEI